MNLDNRKEAFVKLGKLLRNLGEANYSPDLIDIDLRQSAENFDTLIRESNLYNGWFTEDMVRKMIGEIGLSLEETNLDAWLSAYLPKLNNTIHPKTIAVVMAGNIPLVGFDDLLSVLMSGNRLLAKLSSDDDKLMRAIVDVLVKINPEFLDLVKLTDGKIEEFDAVIATGSNNTSRYFDYYFGKYPNIIRKNRNGVAVLNGEESDEVLEGLADDIFLYYGLGCRNISKLYVPEGYELTKLLQVIESRTKIAENHKYFNNYEYNKAIYLVNGTKHFDSGNLLLTENEAIPSPVSVIYFEYYDNLEVIKNKLNSISGQIQCIVSDIEGFENTVKFGKSQSPQLWDYADGVDTMAFLLSLD